MEPPRNNIKNGVCNEPEWGVKQRQEVTLFLSVRGGRWHIPLRCFPHVTHVEGGSSGFCVFLLFLFSSCPGDRRLSRGAALHREGYCHNILDGREGKGASPVQQQATRAAPQLLNCGTSLGHAW